MVLKKNVFKPQTSFDLHIIEFLRCANLMICIYFLYLPLYFILTKMYINLMNETKINQLK